LKYKRIALAAAVAAVALGGSYAAVGIASASSTPAAVRRAVNPVPATPYIVSPPGQTLDDGNTTTIQIGGRTFSGTSVPANATSATVSVSVTNPSSSGYLSLYKAGSSRSGGSTITYRRHQDAAGTATVPLSSTGRITVFSSERVRFTMKLLSFTTPDPAPVCTSTISTIPASTGTLTNVGGGIRAGATDFGSVTLPAGTYDTRVIGGFTGFNNTDTWLPAGVFLTGTMVVVKGADIAADFSNDVTTGGVIIPKSNSTTLTQDPTLAISTFLILNATTEVHVKLFAYASDSGTAGSGGHVKANVQSAQFRNLC
jgi:hypothetical protein